MLTSTLAASATATLRRSRVSESRNTERRQTSDIETLRGGHHDRNVYVELSMSGNDCGGTATTDCAHHFRGIELIEMRRRLVE
jgi:hypothetical protein